MVSIAVKFNTLNNFPNKSRADHVFNSISKFQDCFGVDDIEELKTNLSAETKRHSATNRLKNIFSSSNPNNNIIAEQTTKSQGHSKKLQRVLNKLRKQNKPKCKLFGKLKGTKSLRIPSIKLNDKTINKILWRPSLQTIFKDEILLNALIKYMEKSYNSENILFLQSVKELSDNKHIDIDTKIISIYNIYIELGAEYQINLSYDCYMNIMSKRNQFISYDLHQKQSMFNLCIEEIERLILTSVLSAFYSSSIFQNVAKKIKIL